MMNLLSEVQREVPGSRGEGLPPWTYDVPESLIAGNKVVASPVTPLEFRWLAGSETETRPVGSSGYAAATRTGERDGFVNVATSDQAARDCAIRDATLAGHDDGYQEGEREGRQKARYEMEGEMHANVLRERQRVLGAIEEFNAVQERYFAGVEQEVVKLALAIAARVLHREAQVDALLLAGAVRVAFEKMADRSGVVLHAATEDVPVWEQMFLTSEQAERPRVVGDTMLSRGECVLETKMGTVELGVSAQLEEIEKGFFDLLNQRPVR